jgi:hypothetical protein
VSAALLSLSVVALTQNDPSHPASRVSARGAFAATGGAADPNAGVSSSPPPSLEQLFPATSTTRAGGSSTTTTRLAPTTAARPLPLPATGTYTYAVDGTESTTGFPSRHLPATMTLTIARAGNDVTFTSQFSAQHAERDVLRYSTDGVALTQETRNATFGSTTRSTDARFEPAVRALVLPATKGAAASGASTARDSGGVTAWQEDWHVTDVAAKTLTLAGKPVDTWEVTITRASRPGSADQFHETRTYWYDLTRGLWVRWDETVHATHAQGLTVAYDLTFSASLA